MMLQYLVQGTERTLVSPMREPIARGVGGGGWGASSNIYPKVPGYYKFSNIVNWDWGGSLEDMKMKIFFHFNQIAL
jgi:hypothetical protein